MTVYVVRHANAGSQDSWNGDDRSRPITERGRRQSDAIADFLKGEAVQRLVSSPSRRCVQTLEPLGALIGLAVEEDDRLAEETPVEDTLRLIDEVDEGAVLCSHGEVVTGIITALERRGMALLGPPDWRKGVVWVIERDADGYRQAHAIPPPDRDPL